MRAEFLRFKATLPVLAANLKIADDELDPFRDYRDYMVLLEEFLVLAL